VSPAPEVASDFLLVVFDAKEKVVQSETIPLALSRRSNHAVIDTRR
jgi:hypothetical protein